MNSPQIESDLQNSPVNCKMLKRLSFTLSDVLQRALIRGFHGEAKVELIIQDGTIQEVRETVIRSHR